MERSGTLSEPSDNSTTPYIKKRDQPFWVSLSLSWTHYIRLMRISDPKERAFYEIEAANNNWSVKELNRQFDSALYQRLALSRDKDKILELSKKGQVVEKPGINECRICFE